MSSLLLWVANLVAAVTPQTRLFWLRAAFYRLAGVEVAAGARLNGLVRVHHRNARLGASWVGAGVQVIPTADAAVYIGDRCDIGPGAMFVTGTHELGRAERRAGRGCAHAVVVGDGCWIGARALFLAGSGVGSGCVVAGGAVVTRLFPENVLVAGVPARVVRELS